MQHRKRKGSKPVTERKVIPYHANQNIDDALMATANIERHLVNILNNRLDRDEHYRLLGLCLHEVNQIVSSLKDIKKEN